MTIASLEEAIRLNGTFVKGNLRTFAIGRLAAHAPDALAQLLDDALGTRRGGPCRQCQRTAGRGPAAVSRVRRSVSQTARENSDGNSDSPVALWKMQQ